MPHNPTIEERLRATQERAAVLYRHLLAAPRRTSTISTTRRWISTRFEASRRSEKRSTMTSMQSARHCASATSERWCCLRPRCRDERRDEQRVSLCRPAGATGHAAWVVLKLAGVRRATSRPDRAVNKKQGRTTSPASGRCCPILSPLSSNTGPQLRPALGAHSRFTSVAFLSSRNAMNRACRRWFSPVHSTNPI